MAGKNTLIIILDSIFSENSLIKRQTNETFWKQLTFTTNTKNADFPKCICLTICIKVKRSDILISQQKFEKNR